MLAKVLISSVVSLFITTSVLAATKYSYGLTGSKLASLNLNQADQIFPLVSKYDPQSNTMLKMKAITYDLGGSSDVSNLVNVYLSSFSFNEMKQGGALHLIANVTKVLSVSRKEAGLYEVIAQEWPIGDDWESPMNDFRLRTVKYVVEASQLTVDLRQLNGVDEFGAKQYETPIKVSRIVLD